MDTALLEGDFCPDSRGLPVLLEGREELLQRVAICLTVKKGSFPYLPQLGSRLFQVNHPVEAVEEAREALRFCPEAQVISAEVEKPFVLVRLRIWEEESAVEVKKDGEL